MDELAAAANAMHSGKYDILILDEVSIAIWFNLLSINDVLEFLKMRPENMEIILTGRNAPDELIKIADLVSEMKEVKHYYQQGVQARDGIER